MDLNKDDNAFLKEVDDYLNDKDHIEMMLNISLQNVSVKEKIYGLEHIETARAYDELGEFYYDRLKDYNNALIFYEKAYVIRNSKLGESHQDTINSLFGIAEAYLELDNFDKSLELFLKLLSILGKHEPGIVENRNQRQRIYYCLGSIYHKKEDYKKAIDNYLICLDIQKEKENTKGSNYDRYFAGAYDGPSIELILYNIAEVYYDSDDINKALNYYSQSLEISKEENGSEDYATILCYYKIGLAYHKKGKNKKALEYLHDALKACEGSFGKDHTNTKIIQEEIDNIKNNRRFSIFR